MMKIPGESCESLLEEKKSRFISRVHYVENRNEAIDIIAEQKRNHQQSNHVVYAFIIGDERSETSGMSDDGEPKGTSARPTMEVLKGSEMRNALITTVRYFGGTKLGTGGLVRAYTRAAQAALKHCNIVELKEKRSLTMVLSYSEYEELCRGIQKLSAEIVRTEFSEEVSLDIDVDTHDFLLLKTMVQDISKGKRILRDR